MRSLKTLLVTLAFALTGSTAALGGCGDLTFEDCKVSCDEVQTDCKNKCEDDECKTKCSQELTNCTASCDEIKSE